MTTVEHRDAEIFRYAKWHLVEDYLLCGWIARPALNGLHHGEYAVLVQWLCDCPCAMPIRR